MRRVFCAPGPGFAILANMVLAIEEAIMAREAPGNTQPISGEPEVINDPGNEDPGSLLDDARVPLQEAPDPDASGPDPRD